MPRMLPSGKRDYRYDTAYESSPKQKKNRAARNAARTMLGLKKGDTRDADHRKPLKSGGSTGRSNLRPLARSVNRAKK